MREQATSGVGGAGESLVGHLQKRRKRVRTLGWGRNGRIQMGGKDMSRRKRQKVGNLNDLSQRE